ncbi:MAG TPA: exodeoxyribonuclease V subunit gamma [Jatrophihabitans sp.]|nr:exodeoxyribonuclease V subunit gamma [Jatrophihabitans sp.]
MLLIHRSEHADALVGALGDLLAQPAADPFQPEIVAVPSKGVERWLAQRLSHRLGAGDGDGVCANVVFPSYAKLLDEVAAQADDAYREAVEQWSAERVVWPLMWVIDRCAPSEPWCAVLASHLGLDDSGGPGHRGRRFAVAGKLAALYDRYGRSRPEMIRAWRAGRDEDGAGAALPDDLAWQAELWRRLRAELDLPSPAELLETTCAKVASGPAFSIFGATRIAPARIRILAALAANRDVHLWLHHPSPALWAAVADESPGARRDQQPAVDHPLLASMSRDVRELQELLNTVPHADAHHEIEPRPDTLLGRLQVQLAEDRVPTERRPIDATDDSLQVHAAHGPARQVEVLREAVLGLLAADDTLEPRDVVIMCPNVEAFAPLVAASFGMTDEPGGHPAAQLRVKLADRSLQQTNPLLRLLSQLLELAASRVTATQLLDLAGAAPVRAKFGFDDDDVERLRDWSVAAGARWGLDAAHRGTYGLGGIGQGTWRAAVDRLLLGVAMEDDVAWVGNTLPLDDVDSSDIDLAGRFAEFVDRADHAVRELSATRTVTSWATLLADLVSALGVGDQPWQAMQLRAELDDVAETARDADVELGLADVTALLHARLAGRPTRASFRTGTLTVCTLVPMRSVPHRVVCLLGMDDGAFPRQGIADGDDVLAREPRAGERDPRSEDRQLFLDAVCAAQQHLLIAYTGADPRSGAEVPPCVPLGELLDAVDAAALGPAGGPAREHVVVRHPLQPFDPRNFIAGELGAARPFSFDPAGLAGARAAAGPRTAVPGLVAAPLVPALHEDTVRLDALVQFLQHPTRGFLRQRLDVGTYTDDEEPDDALTVELDALQEWAIGERVLRRCIAGVDRRTAARLEHLRGELPPGPLAMQAMQTVGRRVDALLNASAAERRTAAASIDVAVGLTDGRVLAGTVGGVRGDTMLTVTYSSLRARQRLIAWVRYLALVAGTDQQDWRAVTVGRRGDDACRAVLHGVRPDLARQVLALLVGLRDVGLREPLPIALATSAEYAERRENGARIADAEPAACAKWESDRFRPERDEPEHVLVYGTKAPFTGLTAQQPIDAERFPGEPTRFGALARLVWGPLLSVETIERL